MQASLLLGVSMRFHISLSLSLFGIVHGAYGILLQRPDHVN